MWMLPAIKALLAGAKARFEKKGTKPIFIHTVRMLSKAYSISPLMQLIF